MLDVEQISKLTKTLLEHRHDVFFMRRDDCHHSSSDTNAFSQTCPGRAGQPLHQVPLPVLIYAEYSVKHTCNCGDQVSASFRFAAPQAIQVFGGEMLEDSEQDFTLLGLRQIAQQTAELGRIRALLQGKGGEQLLDDGV